LGSGAQIAGEDLKRVAREALAAKASLDRLAQRAPTFVLEQAAIAGSLSAEAGPVEAAATAPRLNVLADESANKWAATGGSNSALAFERMVRGVTERVVLDRTLLGSIDARRIAERGQALREVYQGVATLKRGGDETRIFGPLTLLDAIFEAGRKGVSVSR